MQNQEVSFLLFVSGLFFIGVVEEFFERIHFVIPEYLVRFEPVCHFFEFVELSITVSFPALLFDGDQSAFSEDADMFGNGGSAHIEMFGNTVERQLLSAQQLKDLSAGGVCDGLKNITSHAPVFAAKINVTDRILKQYFAAGGTMFAGGEPIQVTRREASDCPQHKKGCTWKQVQPSIH